MTNQIQPIFILPEDSKRTIGKDAQRNNIMAAKAVAETIRTTLGPKGMDKMLVSSMGDIIVTNDGATILDEIKIEHPAAKMIVEAAKTQDNEVGDGTTTVAILIGELLKNAEKLLDDNIHPTVIIKGYRKASEKAMEILRDIADDISDSDTYRNIALTAMTGKGAEIAKSRLANLTVDAVMQVKDGNEVSLDDIKIEKKTGESVESSELIKGILMDKERVHSGMPKKITNARIALLDAALEIKSTEIDAKIQISSPEQIQSFLEQEERIIRELTKKVINSKANVVVCQKGIDDLAQHYLAKEGIYAVRRVKKSDMEKLAKATNAVIVSNVNDLTEKELGMAGIVEAKKVGDEEMTYVRECPSAKAVTLLIRGGTSHVVDEIERAVKDALGVLAASIKYNKIVPGAGAVEIELAKELKKYSNTLSGREQLAALAFANSIEIIPRTLAENAGLDPIDVLAELKSRHESDKNIGIDVFTGKSINSIENGIVEPLQIKIQAIRSATEVAELILRIDDVIASGADKGPGPGMPPQGMPEY
ncbi:TCP-1/cpn60 chaperonin family protein [Candidatus Woesearchaeota archaeon]|nr:TCP-1/cpn60 chaperonin family protein [Candidatus Woesearchaeota archaeon]